MERPVHLLIELEQACYAPPTRAGTARRNIVTTGRLRGLIGFGRARHIRRKGRLLADRGRLRSSAPLRQPRAKWPVARSSRHRRLGFSACRTVIERRQRLARRILIIFIRSHRYSPSAHHIRPIAFPTTL